MDEDVDSSRFDKHSGNYKGKSFELVRVLARSGDSGNIPALQKPSKDTDPAVAQEGLRALWSLQSRM